MKSKLAIAAAAALVLCVPAALGAPPDGKGKPEKPGKSTVAPGQSAEKNAAKWCKAELAKLGSAKFKETFGTNPNKANAFGKCVSAREKKADDADEAKEQQARENAAKKCKKLRTDMGVDKFRETYGTNVNGANAFGKCVSKHAKKLLDS